MIDVITYTVAHYFKVYKKLYQKNTFTCPISFKNDFKLSLSKFSIPSTSLAISLDTNANSDKEYRPFPPKTASDMSHINNVFQFRNEYDLLQALFSHENINGLEDKILKRFRSRVFDMNKMCVLFPHLLLVSFSGTAERLAEWLQPLTDRVHITPFSKKDVFFVQTHNIEDCERILCLNFSTFCKLFCTLRGSSCDHKTFL